MKDRLLEYGSYAVHISSFVLFPWLTSVLSPVDALSWLRFVGLGVLAVGCVLIFGSIVMLRRNKGSGLIDWGVYGLVRHPMYVGAMWAFASWWLFHPHWVVLLVSLLNMALVYWAIVQGDQRNLDRFGADYARYMGKVPQANLPAGLWRRVSR